MIDIESDVLTAVATALRTQFSGIRVDGFYISSTAQLPAVSVVEADNRIFKSMRTTKIENADEVMYEVNIFSGKPSGRKAEAKAIASATDAVMESLGFTRTMMEQVPNYADASIFRLVLRYEGIVGPGAEAGKYLVYHSN